MTIKLYYQDSYLRSFEASILETGTASDGSPFVVLDQTAFYPTGGGQPCDLGVLGGVKVIDVVEVDGRILHYLNQPLPEGMTKLQGEIDWNRRFDHMQQHTGQHVLSASFEQLYEAETFGFHLGRETVTVDIARFPITEEEMTAVEELCNRILFENRPVEARFVTSDEVLQLPLRKPPKVTDNIRIVTIQDFDYSPCGGTHPHRTGEVGLIKVLSWEKYKAGTRVEFVCGHRAVREFTGKQRILRQLGSLLGTGEQDLADSVSRILSDRKETDRQLQDARQQLLVSEARDLREHSRKFQNLLVAMKVYENRSMQDLQRLAALVTMSSQHQVCLLAGVSNNKTNLVFAKSPDVEISMAKLLKSVLPLINGKGGGNDTIAQGGGNTSVPPQTLLDESLRWIENPT